MAKFLPENKKLQWILFIILGFVLGAFVSWLLYFSQPQLNYIPEDIRVDSAEYKFINPLLFSRVSKEFFVKEFQPLVFDLNKLITDYTKQGAAKNISVYYRDLNTGHWTGINENEKYDPSSLLKVVTLLTYLKKSLTDPNILTERVYYPGADETGQYYKETEKLTPGNHSILDLLKTMIIESDNKAKEILTNYDTKAFNDTYKEFRLPLPKNDTDDDYMSARSYSVLFRSLFNSTYLPWDVSEQTLSLLSLTNFDKGIVAGVPKDIQVAHKFGEHTYLFSNGLVQNRELHDCGIVYYPGHPYLLCVMTRGNDFPKLETAIRGISQAVYSFVKNSY